jgi:hypothetical protein
VRLRDGKFLVLATALGRFQVRARVHVLCCCLSACQHCWLVARILARKPDAAAVRRPILPPPPTHTQCVCVPLTGGAGGP